MPIVTKLRNATVRGISVRAALVDDGRPTIVLGSGPAAARLGVRPSAAELGEQGCAIRTVPPPNAQVAGPTHTGIPSTECLPRRAPSRACRSSRATRR
jgi:hypothetical protein